MYNWFANDGGVTGGLEFNTTIKGLLCSIDYYHFAEFNLILGETPSEYYNQIGLMIGKHYGEKLFRIQLQGGIAPVWGLRRTDFVKKGEWFSGDIYRHENFISAGLVFKLGFKINPKNYIGLGIDLQVNINSKNSVYMPMSSIEIGKIRT